MIKGALITMCLAAAAPAAAAPPANADNANPRVMSTDFCADQFVLALADEDDIVALSADAAKDFSYLRAKAAPYRRIRPDAEHIAMLSPTVVLRFWGGDARRLKKLGANVVTLSYASDFDSVRATIRKAAAALDQKARGETMIARMDERLDALKRRDGPHLEALYVTPGGVTAGKNTMIDAIMKAAGVRNIAAANGQSYWPPLPAETLIMSPPELIITGFFDAQSERVSHWSAAQHPALRALFRQVPSIHLPADLLSCPAWYSAEAAEVIAAATGGSDDD